MALEQTKIEIHVDGKHGFGAKSSNLVNALTSSLKLAES
jgi:hypothetical protein